MNSFRTIRVLKRISQWELAKLTEIPQSRISLIENNLVSPKPEERGAIAVALGSRVQDIDWTASDKGISSYGHQRHIRDEC